MSFNRISAAEAASLIKHGYNIGLSGFTPAGTAKAVTAELAKIAEAEHAKGNPFQVGIFTGASTGESCDGVLARAKAIRYRAPTLPIPISAKLSTTEKLPTTTYTSHRWRRRCATDSWAK